MAGSAELINLVKRFRLLYDPSDELYTDKAKRDEAWSCIAMLINSTSAEVERQWKILECNFWQCKNMDATKNWMLYDEMVFLDDYMRKSPKIEPESDPTETTGSTTTVSACEAIQGNPFIVRTTAVPGMDSSVQSRSMPTAQLNSFSRTENQSLDDAPSDSDQDATAEEIGNRPMIQAQDQIESPSLSLQLPECTTKEPLEQQPTTVTNGTATQKVWDRYHMRPRLSQTSVLGRPGSRQPSGVTLAKNRKRLIRGDTKVLLKKPDAIQLLFSSYTAQFKRFNRRLQGRLSVQLAQLFAAADNEQAQYEESLRVIQKS